MSELVEKVSGFPVSEQAMRPASKERQCFYCRQPIGGFHRSDCVLIHRTWKLRVTLEIERPFPADWNEELVDSSLTESSWCANNIAQIITDYVESLEETGKPCLCGSFNVEVLGSGDEIWLDEK